MREEPDIKNMDLPELIQLLEKEMEPTEPVDTILQVLKEHEGKKLDKRIIRKMQERAKDPSIRYRGEYGMNHIDWGPYNPGEGQHWGSLLMGYVRDLMPHIDSGWVYEKNPAYFAARDKRNAQRKALLENRLALLDFLNDLNALINRKNEAHILTRQLEERYFPFDDKLYVIRYSIEKRITGAWEGKR